MKNVSIISNTLQSNFLISLHQERLYIQEHVLKRLPKYKVLSIAVYNKKKIRCDMTANEETVHRSSY